MLATRLVFLLVLFSNCINAKSVTSDNDVRTSPPVFDTLTELLHSGGPINLSCGVLTCDRRTDFCQATNPANLATYRCKPCSKLCGSGRITNDRSRAMCNNNCTIYMYTSLLEKMYKNGVILDYKMSGPVKNSSEDQPSCPSCPDRKTAICIAFFVSMAILVVILIPCILLARKFGLFHSESSPKSPGYTKYQQNFSQNPTTPADTGGCAETPASTPDGDSEVSTPGGGSEVSTPGGDSEVSTPGGDSEVSTPGGDSEVSTPGGASEGAAENDALLQHNSITSRPDNNYPASSTRGCSSAARSPSQMAADPVTGTTYCSQGSVYGTQCTDGSTVGGNEALDLQSNRTITTTALQPQGEGHLSGGPDPHRLAIPPEQRTMNGDASAFAGNRYTYNCRPSRRTNQTEVKQVQ